ncbi:hypothetical protein BJF93_06230 [Xaviernesmea oryzae]|uniref:Uncharacterized protein n=1 Tax=Xaviernesmea oryzae TaxID=464029 RepID=A0A1Q9AS59_9HYPH|nr:hypothetical protein [Xaviernesmea oryzae]OLP58218.1 hypothetical protein BJF93_06230 [Xaviernesmea oryzae]
MTFKRLLSYLLPPVLTVLAISVFNLGWLIDKHHPAVVHLIGYGIAAVVLLGLFTLLVVGLRRDGEDDEPHWS